jgi:glycosyltransferase involved in cell wall biosynthesis
MYQKRILSNFKALGDPSRDAGFEHDLIRDDLPPWKLLWKARGAAAVVLDNSYAYLISFCFLKRLAPWNFKLLMVDSVLYKPETFTACIVAFIKKLALKQVDHFAQVFKDLKGYARYYGITPQRCSYLPFKVNGWEAGLDKDASDPCEGFYVICVGRTARDHKTFIEAMRICGLPGVLLVPNWGGVVPESRYVLPQNLRLEVHSDGKPATFINWIKGAAIVVIPRFASAIFPNGISTYLTAMGANRCVVVTKGPGVDELLDGEAITVQPEDPADLAYAISHAWSDKPKRREVALKGRRYAERMQGERRYMTDLLKIIEAQA